MVSTPRGISYPTEDDKIKDGSSASALADDFAELATSADAAITQGVQEAKDDSTNKYGGLPDRVTSVEQKNIEQDTRLSNVESKNTAQDSSIQNLRDDVDFGATKNSEQDGRLDGLEEIQAIKSVRMENGQWVWDLAGATHYVLIAHDGKPTVRATQWPQPSPTTPEFTW